MLVEGVQTFFLEAGKQEKLVYLLMLPAWSYLTLVYMRLPYVNFVEENGINTFWY
jgi:hypothetical protein